MNTFQQSKTKLQKKARQRKWEKKVATSREGRDMQYYHVKSIISPGINVFMWAIALRGEYESFYLQNNVLFYRTWTYR